jgi:anti-sigma factor ChrR (cupin superfamily)
MEEILNLYDNSSWIDAKEYPDGTSKKLLHDEKGVTTFVLKIPRNFKMAAHSHITAEQHFVLKGEYHTEGKEYPEGSFRHFRAHEEHGPFESKDGAIILVIWYPFEANK